MDKRKVIITAIPWFLLGALFREYLDLVHDFKLLNDKVKEDEEMVEKAREVCTEFLFAEIVENFDPD